jgi:hypothetical protein
MIMPGVKFRQDHRMVSLGMKCRIWSTPSREDGEMTARILIGCFWNVYFLAFILTVHPLTLVLTIGTTDVVFNLLGIRTTVYFVPIFLLAFAFALLILASWLR